MDRRTQLSAALESYRPADPREEGFRRQMLALLAAPGDPFSRLRFSPGHFTASAFVLGPGGRDLLMIHHRRLERWLQPGGHVEPGDRDLCAAALREVAEETGVGELFGVSTEPFDLDIHPIPARREQPEHLHLDVRFLFRAAGEPIPASDAVEARWIPRVQAAGLNPEPAMTRVLAKLGALGPLAGAQG